MSLFKVVDHFLGNHIRTTITPRLNFFIYFFILIMLLIVSRTMVLLHQSKLDAIEKAQLKQQSIQNELLALKNQLNPHFLFNSLNSLSLLVREDQKSAGKFINKLSFLYRYILQSKDRNLVSIKEELKLIESYVFLIKQRYRDNFKAKIAIDDKLFQQKIPALALQLLVENSVKHNEISKENPLLVEIFSEDDYIVVKNKLQKRTGAIESTHTGLSNLNKRFELLVRKNILIENDSSYFIVKLPIV